MSSGERRVDVVALAALERELDEPLDQAPAATTTVSASSSVERLAISVPVRMSAPAAAAAAATASTNRLGSTRPSRG